MYWSCLVVINRRAKYTMTWLTDLIEKAKKADGVCDCYRENCWYCSGWIKLGKDATPKRIVALCEVAKAAKEFAHDVYDSEGIKSVNLDNALSDLEALGDGGEK